MDILEVKTGLVHRIRIDPIENADFKRIGSERYWFSWRKEKGFDIQKLTIQGSEDILGLMSLQYIDEEKRVEIRLLTCSRENVGAEKVYSGIAGCLIAYACRLAVVRYRESACVSLVPKTRLRNYYMTAYGMLEAGLSLCLIDEGLIKMLTKHDL